MSVRGRLAIACLVLFAPTLHADFRFWFDSDNTRWQLSNGLLEASFHLTPSGTFEFEYLKGLSGEGTWNAASIPTSLARFTVDDNYYNARTRYKLISQSVQSIDHKGYRQTIVLQDLAGLLRLTLDLSMYEGQPVLRHRVTITNLQSTRVHVQLADLLGWSFADESATFRSFRINQWAIYPAAGNFEPLQDILDPAGPAIEVHSGSRAPNCSWFAIADHTGRGLFAGWEFDGSTNAQIQQVGASNAIRLSAYIADLNHPVEAGADFRFPAAFVGVFQGDWDYAGYRTQRFVENVLAKAAPDPSFPYVAWDSWGYQKEISEYTLRRNAEAAAKLGFELFTVDLGWARQIGDWHEDPVKFPNGLRSISDYVHSLGMKFGLHFAFAEAAPNSPVLTQHPDWTSSVSYGYFGANSLCLSNQATHDWLVNEAVRIIDDYNVDWILQDGENMVKQCTKTTHTHDPKDSNYSNAVDGLNSIVNAVQKARPNVAWENCADGGTMMTFNMVKNYVTSITNDASSISDARRAVYGATYPFPPRYADRYMTDQVLDKYTTRSYMFGGPWVFMNRLTDFSSDNQDLASSEIRVFKGMRASIRDGQVFHINAPAHDTVDAIQSYNAATGVSVAVVTRDGVTSDNYNLLFRGLDPEKSYLVTFQEDRRILSATGLQLMRSGVVIYLPEPHYSEIVFATPLEDPPGQ